MMVGGQRAQQLQNVCVNVMQNVQSSLVPCPDQTEF